MATAGSLSDLGSSCCNSCSSRGRCCFHTSSSLQFDMLEMDRLEVQLVQLPLLQDASSYVPDSVDLTEDALARDYWLDCFEDALDGVRLRPKDQRPRSALGLVWTPKVVTLDVSSWTGGTESRGQPAGPAGGSRES